MTGVIAIWGVPWVESLKTPADIAREQAREKKDSPVDQGPSDATVMAGAMMVVKERAVDPGSVRFRNVVVVRQSSGTKAACGEFNAKNRAGGYNGFERFISAGTGEHTFIEGEVADFGSAWATVCAR